LDKDPGFAELDNIIVCSEKDISNQTSGGSAAAEPSKNLEQMKANNLLVHSLTLTT